MPETRNKHAEAIAALIEGDVVTDEVSLDTYSRDTSIFTKRPEIVIFPKHADDVARVVQYAREHKGDGKLLSVTARSAGTDMTGGPLTESLLLVFPKYMNHIREVADGYAVAEPGVYYRDFEKETLKKNLLLPSFPASRELCALGGMISNNAAGERTLEYGQTEKYVEELDVVLSDGSKATFGPLTRAELRAKKELQTLEGDVYRKMSALIEQHKGVIKSARPDVSKNAAGYALWNVYDERADTFNLSKLIVGSQGTLAMVTQAKLRLVPPENYRSMLIIFLQDFDVLPEIVKRVLKHNPECFESYDDHTFTLAIKFLPQILRQMGFFSALRLGFSYIPEVRMVMTGGVPKLVLMAEFSETTHEAALAAARAAQHDLSDLGLKTRIAKNEAAAEKYWKVRRESFALLRKNLKGLCAASFIEDFVINPRHYPKFLPELTELLSHYSFTYTIAGHIGSGNFHLIPLLDLSKAETREMILELTPKVYELVCRYGGSITGEHNDGIIRTPYLERMFGKEIVALFEETKRIFDPENIFNPGKKVGGTTKDIKKYMLTQCMKEG